MAPGFGLLSPYATLPFGGVTHGVAQTPDLGNLLLHFVEGGPQPRHDLRVLLVEIVGFGRIPLDVVEFRRIEWSIAIGDVQFPAAVTDRRHVVGIDPHEGFLAPETAFPRKQGPNVLTVIYTITRQPAAGHLQERRENMAGVSITCLVGILPGQRAIKGTRTPPS